MMVVIINRRLSTDISFHEMLHRFQDGGGTGTPLLKSKLIQQLMAMTQEVMYVIFLDLYKANDTLDRDRFL